MNNSFFGKTMEKLRKRISVKLLNNAKDYVKCISKLSFVSQKMFIKNFVAIHEIKPVLTLNKPIYVGFSILDLSKYLMYEFDTLKVNLMLNYKFKLKVNLIQTAYSMNYNRRFFV